MSLWCKSSREIHDQTGDEHSDQFNDLNAAGSAAENVADFKILQQLAGDG